MKIRETNTTTAGGLGRERTITIVRVRELSEGEDIPAGAEKVPDKTEVHDWKEAE